MDVSRFKSGHKPILPDKDTFSDRTGPKEPQMRCFGFLVVALAAIAMFFSLGQRDRTGTSLVPPSDKLAAGASAGKGDLLHTASGGAKRPSVQPAPATSAPPPGMVKVAADPANVNNGRADAPPSDRPALIPVNLVPSSPNSNSPQQPLSERDLATAAQQELARAGCYNGEIDGKWGGKSRAAAEDFNAHTGAGFDSDDPSEALLTALRGAPEKACELSAADVPGQGVTSVKADVSPAKAEAKQPALTERDVAYLPPWMREQKLANANAGIPDATPSVAEQDKAEAAKREKSARRRAERSWKDAATRPMRGGERNWPQLKGWPRSSR